MPFNINRKLFTYSEYVKSVDLHPSEPWLLTCLNNGTIDIRNLESDTIFRTYEVASGIECVKFIPRKYWFVVGSSNGKLYIFDYNTHTEVMAVEAHLDCVSCLAIHPTAPIVLTGSNDKTIKAWDWDNQWHSIQTYQGHSKRITNITFNPKNFDNFVSASVDRNIKMWSIASPVADFTIKAHDRGVNYVEFYLGDDKPYLITAGRDKTIKIWDYLSKHCIQTLKGHADDVSFAVFHPKLPIIISGSEDGTIKIWDIDTYKVENTLNYELGPACRVALYKGATEVAVSFGDNVVTLKPRRHELTFSIDHPGKLIYTRDYQVLSANLLSLDMTTLTSSPDGVQIPLQTKDLGLTKILPSSLLHSPNGRFATVVGDSEYGIYTTVGWRNESFGTGISFAWSQDSDIYAVLESETKLKIYNKFTEKIDGGMKGVGTFVVEELYPGPLLGARGPGYVIFWDWDTGDIVRKIDVDAKNIYWSTTRKLLITSSETSSIFYFDYDTYQDKLNEHRPTRDNRGIPESFILLSTLQDTIQSAQWIGDCLICITPTQLYYLISSSRYPKPEAASKSQGLELVSYTISSSVGNKPHLLGFITAHEKVYTMDRDMKVYGFGLSFEQVLQMVVTKGDTGGAWELLRNASKEQVDKVVRSLEVHRDMHELAMRITELYNYQQCTALTMKLMEDEATRKHISKLQGDKAQDMVEFLSQMVNDNGVLAQQERRRALHPLSEFAKSAGVFPRSLELEGVQCTFEKPVASGAYGAIFQGQYKKGSICVKAVRIDLPVINLKAQARELITWAHLLHLNILPFLGFYFPKVGISGVCIVSPWMKHGNLFEFVQKKTDAPRKPLIRDIISGLQYLHDYGIIHADLKAKNVLVSENGRAMLADFGISRLSMTQGMSLTAAGTGTPYWMAPELILHFQLPSRETDIWAFACTCYEIITYMLPFGQYETLYELKHAFHEGDIIPTKPEEPKVGWDEDVWSVAEKCWKSDSTSRPEARKLLDMINSFNFLDDRPSDSKTQRRQNSVAQIDYNRILGILDEIRKSAAALKAND